ncbi:MAG: class I tRNA ligase family protein [Planctomycetota bacterium]
MNASYTFQELEPKWQQYWAKNRSSRAANPGEPGSELPKFYILDFFPYPSGTGLHVGHPLGYIASDIIARYMRMRGYNVLHPMGWDAFGLPAEQFAVETGVHPRETTRKNIETYKRQLKTIGLGYDWDRELATSDEKYYRWTQWIFLQIYNSWYDPERRWTDVDGREVVGAARPIEELPIPPDVLEQGQAAIEEYQAEHRLAYLAEVPVNWCPALGTVLSNEEVTNDGRSDRGNHPVYRRPMRQWMLRITEYAERLLGDLDTLDWPEPIKLMQRNWIGRSEGAYVDFRLDAPGPNGENVIRVFTTRPDTLFGSTYMVLAPEHGLVPIITTEEQRDQVKAYVEQARQKSDLDRTVDTKTKTGVFTGAYAINPVNRKHVPIWVADYVLMGYGTGSIMAVPAHDQRDYEFSKTFDIPICDVIYPPVVAAMQYYVEHIPPESRTTDNWREALAEFLGGVPVDIAPEQFKPQLQAFVDRHLKQHPSNSKALADAALKQLPAIVEQKLGNSNVQWLDVFQTLELDSIDTLAKRFHQAIFYDCAGEAFTGDGYNVHSPPTTDEHFTGESDLNNLRTPEAKRKITQWLESCDLGEGTIQYKLRDWLFSRQRYWGEPFPILYRPDGCIESVDEAELPVALPEMEDFRPHASDDPHAEPRTPLSRAAEWQEYERAGTRYRRELNTMPQWAGSCWYYLRFCDAHNDRALIDPQVERYWLGGQRSDGTRKAGGVDLYMGGAEHAVLHLLYARFWHKVLYDLRHVSTPEPFDKLFNQGMITAFAYQDARGIYVHYDDIDFREDGAHHRQTGEKLVENVAKMSKTLKNVVNPDRIIEEYGADTLRLYEMYMGPLEASKPWNTRDIIGVHRFLQRVWRLIIQPLDNSQPEGDWRINSKIVNERDETLERLLHKTIKKVEEDIQRFALNTAIAQMIVWVNEAGKAPSVGRDQVERFLAALTPFTPHICAELLTRLGHTDAGAGGTWPSYDQALTRDATIEMAVQVNGKVRGRIQVAENASDDDLVSAARADEGVDRAIGGKQIKRVIVVKGRLLNLIVG